MDGAKIFGAVFWVVVLGVIGYFAAAEVGIVVGLIIGVGLCALALFGPPSRKERENKIIGFSCNGCGNLNVLYTVKEMGILGRVSCKTCGSEDMKMHEDSAEYFRKLQEK